MSTEEKTKLVPKLRFPEFRVMDEWALNVIGDYLDESRVPSSLNDPSKRITVRLHLLGVERREHRGTESTESTNNFSRKSGQFIYGKQNIHKGAFGLVPTHLDGFETSQDLPCFDFKPRCHPLWFCYHLSRENVYCALEPKMTGTGSKRLNEKTFLTLSIATPKYPEQEKIAHCLSSLDELIAAQVRKVEVLKTYKQGLMQQIFPREGETQPRLRFPEFETAVDWVSKKLEDLAKRGSGHTPSKSKPEYYEGKIKWVSLADSKRLDAGLIYETATSISAQGIKNSSAVLHPAGTVLISRDAGVGKSAVMATPMAVSQHFIVWTCYDQLLSNWFLYYVLQVMKPIFERNATGSTIKTIGLPFFKELQIAVPLLPEQKRIADCLSSLDALITASAQELDTFRLHKKALSQQLFPSVEMIEQ